MGGTRLVCYAYLASLAQAVNLDFAHAFLRQHRDESVCLSPISPGHTVQFYSEDDFLLHKLSGFVGSALNSGNAALVIATREHRALLAESLASEVPDFTGAVAQKRYVAVDANDTLARFMVGGVPDRDRFFNVVGKLAAQTARGRALAAFGEMVAVLWERGQRQAAVDLEKLWNELLRQFPMSLLCGYRMQQFGGIEDRDAFATVCSEHTRVVPDRMNSDQEPEDPPMRELARLQQESLALQNELQWRGHEERYRRFIETVQDYALFMLDASGNVTTWNPGAEKLKGYKPEEIIGKHFSRFYMDEDVRSGRPEVNLATAVSQGHCEDEGWRVRKDGTKFWANVVITALRDDRGTLIGFGKVTRDFTDKMEGQRALDRANRGLRREMVDRRLAEEKLAESEKSLRALSLHLLRSQDEERRRIGRDLHDSLGQMLTAIKLSLQSIAPLHEAEEQVNRCVKLADDCIKEVRTISYLLYPPMLEELGLRSAIPWYLDGFAARSGIRTTFSVSADFDRLSRDLELGLFRVLQEGLTNVHRHSGSPVAHIRLLTEGVYSILEIRDEGKGVPAEVASQATALHSSVAGVGLRGMNERLRQLNGRLELSNGKKGTILRAVVPSEAALR